MIRDLVVAVALLVGAAAVLPHVPLHAPESAASSSGSDCQATVIATDGTPPPGTPTLDPQRLCNALQDAEATADCMGDYQPPNPDRVNAREFCVEVQRRGCGTPGQDCDEIPADQTYYHHH